MSSSFKVGIIGSSRVTNRHIKTLYRFPNVQITGICGTYEPALTEISARYGLRVVPTLDDLLAQGPVHGEPPNRED